MCYNAVAIRNSATIKHGKSNDMGYKVFIKATQYVELNINDQIEFYIHQHIREDALDLYGFNSLAELEMFELLLSISGVGPKSALNALTVASVDELQESIGRGDSSLLVKVSGIGKKTAERIVLELKDKVIKLDNSYIGNKKFVDSASDEIDALMALGYSLQQARESLGQVDPKIKDSGERIRAALQASGN